MFTMTYPFKMWATLRAGHRLGVETTIERVAVLFVTSRTQRKRRHHGKRAVVRHGANNGETRAAVGTVDKRITITPFARVFISARQAGQVAASGTICVFMVPPVLWRIVNSVGSCDQMYGSRSTLSIRQRRAVLMQLNKKRFRVFQQPDFYAIAVITDIAVKI